MSSDPNLTAAVAYWTDRLEQLDTAITTTSARHTLLGVPRALQRLRVQRGHLATVLRALGEDVPEINEKEKSNG